MSARDDKTMDVLTALINLRAACDYVAPLAGCVATESTVSHLRDAARFIKACKDADAAIAAGIAAEESDHA